MFIRPFDIGLDWKFKKVVQRLKSNVAKILIWRTLLPIKLHDAGKFTSYHIHKKLPNANIWPWPSSKGQRSNLDLIRDFDIENIPVKLHVACNSWGVIEFISQLDFEHSKRSHKGQHQIIRDVDVENIPIKLHGTCTHVKAIYAALSGLQGVAEYCLPICSGNNTPPV